MLLECDHCEALVDAHEIAEHEFGEPLGEPVYTAKVTLAKCPRCDGPMLGYQDELTSDDSAWSRPVRIFPARHRDLHHSVPKPIGEAFTEARTCIRAKAFTASVIMCRKTLEGICSAHGAKSGSLEDKLKKLKESGVIESRLFDWAEMLRTTGNEAAHDVEFIGSREDARDLLEFTEALLEYVFTYRHKFEEFETRRAKAISAVKEEPADGRQDEPF